MAAAGVHIRTEMEDGSIKAGDSGRVVVWHAGKVWLFAYNVRVEVTIDLLAEGETEA